MSAPVPHLLDFWHFGIGCSYSLKMWHSKSDHHWWTPAPSETFPQETVHNYVLEQAEVCSSYIQGWRFSCTFCPVRLDLNSVLWWLWLRWPPITTSLRETSSFNKQQLKKIVFPSTPSTYTTKLSPMCLRILLDLFVPAVWCSQLSSGKSKFPTRQLKIFEINKQTRHFHNHYSDQISN